MIIDSTMLSTYKSCPQKFFRTYVENWKPKRLSVHLHSGKCFAKGLEAARLLYYEGGQPAKDAIEGGLDALYHEWGDFESPHGSAKTLDRTIGALRFYFDHYPLDSAAEKPYRLDENRVAVEFPFEVKIEENIFCGRLDAVMEYADGLYVMDEKTASSLGPTWSSQFELRGQFIGYVWACRKLGINVNGVIVRGVSILKTKYDTQQVILSYSDHVIGLWEMELYKVLEDIQVTKLWSYNFGDACNAYGGCHLKSICASVRPYTWLEADFEKRVWNPLTRDEERENDYLHNTE